MKRIYLIFKLLLFVSGLNSQTHAISAGYGNFEGFNIAMQQQSKRLIYMYGYGNDLNIFGQGYYNCVFAGIGRPLLKEQLNTDNILSLHGRVLVWNIENKSNIFSAVSFSPLLQFTRKLNTHFFASVYAGYVYTSVFSYKRKGYHEIGWPKEWLPDFGLSVQYCLSCK